MPTAIITFVRPLPRMATIAIANRMPGKASMTSMTRMTTSSSHPP